jgi:hypothetical protein
MTWRFPILQAKSLEGADLLCVISREGAVVWSGHGPYDPANAAALEEAATAARNDGEGGETWHGS